MSFAVFLQAFANGDAADGDGDAMAAVLRPLIEDEDRSWARIVTADGSADIYGLDHLDTGCMINHASGSAVWDVVYEVARAGRMALMPEVARRLWSTLPSLTTCPRP